MTGTKTLETTAPDRTRLFEIASEQGGYFTAEEAGACGFSRALLSHHVKSGRFTRVRRGLYRFREYPSSPREHVLAAWLAVGKEAAVVSHESALELLGLCDVIPDAAHITVPRSRRNPPSLPGIKVHTTARPLAAGDQLVRDGVAVTSAARSILDAAEVGTAPEQIETAIAQALERGMATPQQLREGARERSRRVAILVETALRRSRRVRNHMPLSEQEQRCVDLACRYLGERYGGSWSIQQHLDDLHPSEPTPEVIVGNGAKRAAIEVKRLTGDAMHQEYVASLRSNEKFLVPSCGGSYYLNPAVDFRLPMPDNLRRLVKREIERVAPNLQPDQKGAIRIPRQGHVSLVSESGPSLVWCYHGNSQLMSRISKRVTGTFMLIDEGLEHSFVTEEGEAAFEEVVVKACSKRLEGKIGPFTWYEEWELGRLEGEGCQDGENGVWIVAATDARSMQESVEECVHTVLVKAMRKFRKKRWADLQIIVLETSGLAPAALAAHAVETFKPGDRNLIDHFLLVDGEDVIEARVLVSALSRAAEADEQRRRQHIIDSPVPEARVQRFKEDYLKCRRDIGATEKIFNHYGAFQHRNERNNLATFGFNRLVHKGPFVDGSNWADLRGWEFAVAEERRLFKDLHTHLAESASQSGQMLADNVPRQPTDILRAADGLSGLLGAHGFQASLVVVATHLDIDTLVALTQALAIPNWQLTDDLRTNRILGKHGSYPVLYIKDHDLDSLYVVDVQRFAKLVQFDPLVELSIQPIDEARAEQMLEDRPDLKLDINALRSRVHLRLYQSYGFEIRDRHAVWAAKFSP